MASQEQARGIEQVNKAVSQMDQVTQQNAANSEESSSAAEELSSQAEELAAMIGRFQLNRGNSGGMGRTEGRMMAMAGHKPMKALPTSAHLKPTRDKGRKMAPSGNGMKSGISLSPEDVIPLDSDPDFKNF